MASWPSPLFPPVTRMILPVRSGTSSALNWTIATGGAGGARCLRQPACRSAQAPGTGHCMLCMYSGQLAVAKCRSALPSMRARPARLFAAVLLTALRRCPRPGLHMRAVFTPSTCLSTSSAPFRHLACHCRGPRPPAWTACQTPPVPPAARHISTGLGRAARLTRNPGECLLLGRCRLVKPPVGLGARQASGFVRNLFGKKSQNDQQRDQIVSSRYLDASPEDAILGRSLRQKSHGDEFLRCTEFDDEGVP